MWSLSAKMRNVRLGNNKTHIYKEIQNSHTLETKMNKMKHRITKIWIHRFKVRSEKNIQMFTNLGGRKKSLPFERN